MAILSGVEDVKAERESVTTTPALLVNNACVGTSNTNRSVVVTANGDVTLTEGGNMYRGMRFSYYEWWQIVEFTKQQIAKNLEKGAKWNPATDNPNELDW